MCEKIIDKKLNKLPYSKHFRAKIVSKKSASSYEVLYKGKKHTVAASGLYGINEFVWICIPSGNWKEAYIEQPPSGNKILWAGVNYMHSGQTITLSDHISGQRSGIVLVWQAYVNQQAINADFVYTFIPKFHIQNYSGAGVCCWLAAPGAWKTASKYVYVKDRTITGHDINSSTGSASGITYDATYWVLTKVLGI